MDVKFKKVKLGDVIINESNKRIPLSSSEREKLKGQIPYYGAQGIIDYVNDYIFDGEYILVAEDGNNLKTLQQDIALLVNGKFWVNNHAHVIKANKENDTRYLKYLINTVNVTKYVTGSAQPKLNKANLEKIEISLPPLEEQRKVANYLSNLDNQIELNNQINQELEEMAQTLYNYWFVQFEFPNEEGKPYKSSGGKMVWNEELKREIPEGWEVKRLDDLLIKNNQKIREQSEWENEKLIDLSNMPGFNMCLSEYDLGSKLTSNIYKMNQYDILFGSIRPYLGKAGFAPFDGVTTGTVHSFSPKKDVYYSFCLLSLTRKNFFEYAVSRCKGSKMPVIGADDILDYKVALPLDRDITKAFNDTVFEFVKMMKDNIIQNQELIELRDYMLPLLMSGQVTIED